MRHRRLKGWALQGLGKCDKFRKRRPYLTMQDGFNPFNPEFTIVIFIHYKPRIAAAILD